MENGWKMEDGKCTPHGPPPGVAFKWYPFFTYEIQILPQLANWTPTAVVGAVGIESTNYMETKELCGAPRPSKSFKGTQWNP